MNTRNRAGEMALPTDWGNGWNQPTGAATTLVQEMQIQLGHMENLNPGKAIKILYGGPFGTMRAKRVAPRGGDFLLIEARDNDGLEHSIIAPVSQCSFAFSIFLPTTGEPADRVIFGFAEGQSEN